MKGRASAYIDNDDTSVITASVEGNVRVNPSLGISAGTLVDSVTKASVDVIAAATRPGHEDRYEYWAGAALSLSDVDLSASYGQSIEFDYSSHSASLGGTLALAGGATELSADVGVALSDVGRGGDPNFSEHQTAVATTVGVTQLIDRASLLAVRYSLHVVEGYQSSPYRHVRLENGGSLLERHPRLRVRHALVGQYRRSLDSGPVLGVDQRLYADNWGLMALTSQVKLSVDLTDEIRLEVRERVHLQGAVSFYTDRYVGPERFVTADRELGPMVNSFTGAGLVMDLAEPMGVHGIVFDIRADYFVYRYLEPIWLVWKHGLFLSSGVGVEF